MPSYLQRIELLEEQIHFENLGTEGMEDVLFAQNTFEVHGISCFTMYVIRIPSPSYFRVEIFLVYYRSVVFVFLYYKPFFRAPFVRKIVNLDDISIKLNCNSKTLI